QLADRTGGDSIRRVAVGREALKQLAAARNGFVAQNPPAKARIETLERQHPAYVAHEFLNEHWVPLYVTEAMAMLAEAKLDYAGSASIAENRAMLSVPAELMPLVQGA